MNRLDHLDSLRGFSLFGILLVNMLGFQYGIENQQNLNFANQPDSSAYFLIQLLFQGSFYPVFAILFGIGGALMYENAANKEHSFHKTYSRRLILLLVIGLIHWVLLWHGDILIDYAITGLILMMLLSLPAKKLLMWVAGGFTLVLILGLTLIGAGSDWFRNGIEREVMISGGYLELMSYRIAELAIDPLVIAQVLSLFLIGAVLVQWRWIHDIGKYRHYWLILAGTGIILGLLGKLPGILSDNAAMTYYSYMFGGPLFGIGVIAVFFLLYHHFKGFALFRWLTFPGRTALTNYLTQSVMMTFIFYGYGLGQFEQIGITGGILLVVVIFTVQVIISKLWLTYFKLGPVEWLWRSGTYLKLQTFKK